MKKTPLLKLRPLSEFTTNLFTVTGEGVVAAYYKNATVN